MDSLASMAAVDGYHRELVMSSLQPTEKIVRVTLAHNLLTFGVVVKDGQEISTVHHYKRFTKPMGIMIHDGSFDNMEKWTASTSRYITETFDKTQNLVFVNTLYDGFVVYMMGRDKLRVVPIKC